MDAINPKNNNAKLEYQKIKGERFMVYSDCTITDFKVSHYRSVSFEVTCDTKTECQVVIYFEFKPKAQNFSVTTGKGKDETIIPLLESDDKNLEYAVPANSKVTIRWK